MVKRRMKMKMTRELTQMDMIIIRAMVKLARFLWMRGQGSISSRGKLHPYRWSRICPNSSLMCPSHSHLVKYLKLLSTYPGKNSSKLLKWNSHLLLQWIRNHFRWRGCSCGAFPSARASTRRSSRRPRSPSSRPLGCRSTSTRSSAAARSPSRASTGSTTGCSSSPMCSGPASTSWSATCQIKPRKDK